MIEVAGLSKWYGRKLAVDDLTFAVAPGRVTGLLGPRGAGKSTTLRIALGLDRPSAGEVRFDGKRYHELKHPLRTVGSLLDGASVHPNRSARAHLAWMAKSNRIPAGRVDDVLGIVGLGAVADKRARELSVGMKQRLGVASALLGDPAALLFDEPMTGGAPEDVLWVRRFTHHLAEEGRTVLVSSHHLAELALTASQLVVINAGRLVCQSSTTNFLDGAAEDGVKVRAPRQRTRPADTGTTLTDLTDSLVASGSGLAEPGPDTV